ncbi:MAG: ATP phosphoribosyltransferase regulatory subunit [Oscillospiraceae bacterium]|nr:ATP phosphoribosyltransferase regulatory subunit [Oscillospiraceae bacterium]
MKRYNKNIPDGTADIIFDKTFYIKKAADIFTKVYEDLNYREIITPTIEYYDVFNFISQPIPQEMMYKLTDNSGRLLVLRPDNTTPISRVVSTKLKPDKHDYLKIYYNQNVFRINTDYSGKKSEIIQSGIEIIGVNGMKTDIHYIETALKVLKSTGLNFKLEIGHVGFYKSIINSLNLKSEEKEVIRLYIESKNTGEINNLNINENEYEIIRMIPQLFGGYEVIEKARGLAENNREAQNVLDYLYKLYTILDNSGYGEHIIIDLGIVHEIDYYTGLVISGYVDGIGENVLAGGRYDNLIANFGLDLPAVGFAVNINLIAKALENAHCFQESMPISEIVHYSAENYDMALNYINGMKKIDKYIKIELSCFETLKETEEYAAKNGIERVVTI